MIFFINVGVEFPFLFDISFIETIQDQLHNQAQITKGNLGFKVMEEEVEVIPQ